MIRTLGTAVFSCLGRMLLFYCHQVVHRTDVSDATVFVSR